jgi:hypothetical protein
VGGSSDLASVGEFWRLVMVGLIWPVWVSLEVVEREKVFRSLGKKKGLIVGEE